MGTMLYAQGVFINRSFDSLNIVDPHRVLAVHHAYVRAGADVLETNTFGANRIKLRAFGLTDRLRDINEAGVRLAREAAGESVYVAGAVGPIGLRIEPWGRTGCEEAKDYFREQAEVLAACGVDLFVLETFRDLNEILAAIHAVRDVSSAPIVAQMTTEEDGNSLDGTSPEQFAPVLRDAGADVIGLNCSIGPAHMLETLERMAAVTGARLSAQPNAGRPRDVEGRTIYLTSPEYMASYARRFAERRVRLIGGCCGTTPDHISQIKAAISRVANSVGAVAASASAPASVIVAEPTVRDENVVAPTPFRRALTAGQWVRLVELVPPRGGDVGPIVDQARRLHRLGIDAIQVPDAPPGARMSALAVAVVIQQQVGIDAVLQYSSRDRALLVLQSELLGAYAMGVRHLVAVTGDVRPAGDYSDATAVLDVDSIGLAHAVARLNEGFDVGGQAIGTPTSFFLGVTVNPGAEDLEAEIRRFEYKVEAGAQYVITKPVFDVAAFERVARRLENTRLPIVLSLRPLESALDADYLANEVPGAHIPDEAVTRMRGATDAAREGVSLAAQIGRALKEQVHGINIAAPAGRFDLALALLEEL